MLIANDDGDDEPTDIELIKAMEEHARFLYFTDDMTELDIKTGKFYIYREGRLNLFTFSIK